mmetsp:Transcript_6400/g.13918  ORF Transcript_6400/g.13918 Transcript_6400/m.13918 type:complete len:220 (-) Transcript_6400:2469-3128(-)
MHRSTTPSHTGASAGRTGNCHRAAGRLLALPRHAYPRPTPRCAQPEPMCALQVEVELRLVHILTLVLLPLVVIGRRHTAEQQAPWGKSSGRATRAARSQRPDPKICLASTARAQPLFFFFFFLSSSSSMASAPCNSTIFFVEACTLSRISLSSALKPFSELMMPSVFTARVFMPPLNSSRSLTRTSLSKCSSPASLDCILMHRLIGKKPMLFALIIIFT